jgi:hypothetical protein
MALVEQHAATLTPFQRESVYAELLSVDPDDAYARGARGEVKGPRGWVLEKTLVAKARRAEVRALVQGALASAPAPVDVAPEAQDLNYQVPWRASVGTDRVRVFTTGERAEALRAVQVLHASRDVFDGLLGVHVDLGEVLRVYLLCDPASKAAFLEHIPDLSAERRAFYAQLEGTGIGPANAAWWAPSPERRLDGIVRHVLGASLTAEFGLTVDTAWAWEGLGLYLTRELVGTRLTWYVRQTETGGTVAARGVQVDWTKKLQTPGTNWMNEGYRLLRARETLGLGAVLTRPLNKLTPEDLFVAYVVGAYLIEARRPSCRTCCAPWAASIDRPRPDRRRSRRARPGPGGLPRAPDPLAEGETMRPLLALLLTALLALAAEAQGPKPGTVNFRGKNYEAAALPAEAGGAAKSAVLFWRPGRRARAIGWTWIPRDACCCSPRAPTSRRPWGSCCAPRPSSMDCSQRRCLLRGPRRVREAHRWPRASPRGPAAIPAPVAAEIPKIRR